MAGTRELLDQIRKYPDLHLPDRNYVSAVAFLLGYDAAYEGGLLDGFREWLVVQNDAPNNLTWPALLLHVALPNDGEPMESIKQLPKANQRAFDLLFDSLFEFLEAKRKINGLRDVFLAYESWLRKQSWYDANSPDWRES